MAWFDDAHAVETVNDGPRRFHAIDTCDTAALFINRGTMQG
jgi:hypothetical protein